ncbi:putative FAD dependent oxidoreductase [Nitrososphaera viennensis EN76]|uniref:Putative FAD dependent oxidoreductase n=1 Tax=Nitrososphaera viennensis EN76 TaxID=926571 RepID=A0A060HL71_9ARCH|nr:putative FAD dependent oxidoreductase [Nitrososphaera viennensis EN76]
MRLYSVAVIGGGILGTSIAYFLSGQARDPGSVALVEQELDIARHTSSRNTGKVHAPFLYDPAKKKLFAKAASLGFEMWEKFAQARGLPFERDGVLEVATDERSIDRLHKYMSWGEANGLAKDDLLLLDKAGTKKMEPNVRCEAAIYCGKDGSVDYGSFSCTLLQDLRSFGCAVLLGHGVTRVENKAGAYVISTRQGRKIEAEFIVNAAGGNAVDIAHSMGVAREYTDLHFRGEYWQAPEQYRDLTRLSVYSVPRHTEYPFLDPHWIVRADGRREVGPNAVPVFGPYAYSLGRNIADMLPKIIESSATGARKVFFDRQFLSLASTELKSSLSKTAMINRVREFLPALRPSAFTERGTAGIRSSVIDREGRFVPDTLILKRDSSVHVLNYNSPGATGALPMAAKVAAQVMEAGALAQAGRARTMWDPAEIASRMSSA